MNKLHTMKNPWAESKITVQCQRCHALFPAQRLNCIDTLSWPEGRQILDEGKFFHPVCPQCKTQAELIYPSRYIDSALGIAAVLIPDIEQSSLDNLLPHMNHYLEMLALDGMQHRVVGNFYAMAEQMRIHQFHLNDQAIQLLKPLIIGTLQAQGLEVWNGFFLNLLYPENAEQMDDTVYISTQENADMVYSETIYQFNIYLTNGDIILRGINDTAYQICMNIIEDKKLSQNNNLFYLYDLAWAINIHNSLYEN